MAKFTTGFLIGAVAGTAYALLTAKQTGAQRQKTASDYVDSLTTATQNTQRAVKRLGEAVSDLRHEIATTYQPAVADIQASVNDFEFQAQPRVDAINQHLDNINQAAEQIDQKLDNSIA